ALRRPPGPRVGARARGQRAARPAHRPVHRVARAGRAQHAPGGAGRAPAGRFRGGAAMSTAPAGDGAPRTDFIRQIVREDLASGKHAAIRTRFPPEPNGYLHIGHAKAICLDFGIAAEFGGRCNLRFDDTNPAKEDPEYVAAIQEDVRWLGFEWASLRHASDYF